MFHSNSFQKSMYLNRKLIPKLKSNFCFSPDEIKYRVKKQVALAKKRERARLLKKGESAKYTATRRQLQADIKDDFFL